VVRLLSELHVVHQRVQDQPKTFPLYRANVVVVSLTASIGLARPKLVLLTRARMSERLEVTLWYADDIVGLYR
jgi:hypothetical protein